MSKKQNVKLSERKGLMEAYIKGNISLTEAARRAGVVAPTIVVWTRAYRNEGVSWLISSQNKVYSPETKRQAVEAYLAGESSQEGVCEKYGIRSGAQLRRWIKVYNAHGDFNSVKQSGDGSYMKQGRETTQEERIQVATNCIASGKNYGEAALKYNVSYQQARTWTLRYEELGEAGLEDRRGRRKKDQTPRTELEKAQIEIEQLKHQNYLLTMERDLLK